MTLLGETPSVNGNGHAGRPDAQARAAFPPPAAPSPEVAPAPLGAPAATVAPPRAAPVAPALTAPAVGPEGYAAFGPGPRPARARKGPRMRWLNDRPIGMRILVCVLIPVLALVATGWLAADRLGQVGDKAESLKSSAVDPVAGIDTVKTQLLLNAVFMNSPTAGSVDSTYQAVDDALAAYQAAAAPLTADEQALFDQFQQAWNTVAQVERTELLPAQAAGDEALVTQITTEKLTPAFTEAFTVVEALKNAELATAERVAAEAGETASSTTRQLWIVVGVVGALALAIGFAISRSITRPLKGTVAALDRVASGDLTVDVPVESKDEIGRMSESLNTAVGRVRHVFGAINTSSAALAESSEELLGLSTSLSANAEQTAAQANHVSVAAEEVSANVNTVAAGTEELGANVQEIARSADQATSVAQTAVGLASVTQETMQKLGESSVAVANVLGMINSIAEQTNLLALNATIEAARAGDAGRGFAVVANEVKDLAQETSKATDEIRQTIEQIQMDSSSAIEAIGQIGSVISEINESQNAIAVAVQEQSATTGEIARTVAEASMGTSSIAENVVGVADAARANTQGAVDSNRAAHELMQLSAQLRTLVSEFRV